MDKKVMPVARLRQYKGLSVARRAVQPTKKQVEEALRTMRYQEAVWEPESGKAARRDRVVVDFEGFFPGNVPIPNSKSEGVTVILGQGKMMSDAEEAICGHCAGESFCIPVTYPDNFPLKSLAGRPVTFTITLHSVERRNMPAADDLFAQSHGCENMEQLMHQLEQKELEKNITVENRRIQTLLLAQAGACMEVAFPTGMLDDQAEQRIAKTEQEMKAAGQNPDLYYKLSGHDRAWHVQRAKVEIEANWRRKLVVEQIAQAEQLTVSKQEIDAERNRIQENGKKNVALQDDVIQNVLQMRKVQQFLAEHAVYTE